MREIKSTITMRDFDLARLLNTTGGDDITEWFSDHDVYLCDIVKQRNVSLGSLNA